MPSLRVQLPSEPIGNYSIQLPASKSMVNRYLILYHLPNLKLEGFNFELLRYSESRDSRLLFAALQNPCEKVWFEDGATPARFFMAWAAAMQLDIEIHGTEGLKKRSMLPLTQSIEAHGVKFTFLEHTGYLPLRLHATQELGAEFTIDREISSQFLSALMLIAPQIAPIVRINTQGLWSSQSYIRLTEKCMNAVGIEVQYYDKTILVDSSAAQLPAEPHIEEDWSSAAWFYQCCALHPHATFHFPNLHIPSLQEDAVLADMFLQLGVVTTNQNGTQIRNTGLVNPTPHFNFINNIDLAPAVICTCAALKLSATFSGYESLRNKESDRLNALKINLESFGVELNEVNGMLELKYPDLVEVNKDIIHIQTFNDHRICMSFALLATKGQEIEIDDPECVEKSFPNFWNALRDCNFVLSHG